MNLPSQNIKTRSPESKYKKLSDKRQSFRVSIRKTMKAEALSLQRASRIHKSAELLINELLLKNDCADLLGWNDILIGLEICSSDKQFLRQATSINIENCLFQFLQSQNVNLKVKEPLLIALLNILEHRGSCDATLCSPSIIKYLYSQIIKLDFSIQSIKKYVLSLLNLVDILLQSTQNRWVVEYLEIQNSFCSEVYDKSIELIKQHKEFFYQLISIIIRIRARIININFNLKFFTMSLFFIEDWATQIKSLWNVECSLFLANALRKCPYDCIAQLNVHLIKMHSSILFSLEKYYPETSSNEILSKNLLTIIQQTHKKQLTNMLSIILKVVPFQFFVQSLQKQMLLKQTLNFLHQSISQIKQKYEETSINSVRLAKSLMKALKNRIQVNSCLLIIENLTHNMFWVKITQSLLQQGLIEQLSQCLNNYIYNPQIIGITLITIRNLLEYTLTQSIKRIPRVMVSHGILQTLEQFSMSKLFKSGQIDDILQQLLKYQGQ